MEQKTTTINFGLSGIALIWGVVTQCLSWAGILDWSWVAIWGPLLVVLGITLVVLAIAGIAALLMYVFGR
jgi:hypothetical protein